MGQEVVLRRQGVRNAQKLGNSVLVGPGDSCTVKLGGWVEEGRRCEVDSAEYGEGS